MAAKRKAKTVTKGKSKRAPAKRAAAKAKRTPAKAKRPAQRSAPKKQARAAPKRRPDASEAVTAAHRAFDPEATQQLSFQEVLGDIEESMALDTLKEDA